jgi:hypothetical protein
MLYLVFLLGLALGKSLEVYSHSLQRGREEELIHVGETYRRALESYYRSSPGAIREFPRDLNDLLRDQRHFDLKRYMRKLYPDPMTGQAFLPIYDESGGIRGVRSSSSKKPIKTYNPASKSKESSGESTSYQDWQFVASDGF